MNSHPSASTNVSDRIIQSNLNFRQKAILTFIYDYTHLVGQPPTLQEMASAVGITSTSHISYHVHRLIQQGYLGRGVSTSRSIVLLQPGYDAIGQQPQDESEITLSKLRDENRRLRT